MKNKDIILGCFLIICSLSAYVFLLGVEQTPEVSSNLHEESIEETGNMPDVDVFKHVVSVFSKLRPGS